MNHYFSPYFSPLYNNVKKAFEAVLRERIEDGEELYDAVETLLKLYFNVKRDNQNKLKRILYKEQLEFLKSEFDEVEVILEYLNRDQIKDRIELHKLDTELINIASHFSSQFIQSFKNEDTKETDTDSDNTKIKDNGMGDNSGQAGTE